MQKLILNPEYEFLREDLQLFIKYFENSGDTVFKGSRNSIKKTIIKDIELNIKQFKIPNFFNSIIYSTLRKSKARRSFEYACTLIKKGISTPFPIGYFEVRSFLRLKRSYYISLQVNYDFDFRELIHKPKFQDRDHILSQFTEFTFKLHENGINFLDHSPGNTLILKKEKGGYEFFLIDLNRMRFVAMDFNQRMRNFRRLWLSKHMVKIMSQTYSKLYGRSFESTYELMMKYSQEFQNTSNKKKLRRSGRRMQFKKV